MKNKSKGKDDPLYPQIKQWVIERNGDVVTADILRIVKKGYMRTARIMDQLVEDGIVQKKE